MRLDAIKRNDVKAFITDYTSAGTLSRNTIRLMLSALRVILNHAIEDGLIDHNPAERLGRLTKTQKAKREATALTRAESEKLLEAVQAICPEQYPLFLTATSGLAPWRTRSAQVGRHSVRGERK
jgi:site-specific recombinase XerD